MFHSGSGRLLVCVLTTLVLSGCNDKPRDDEILIGEIHPMTGPASFYGLPQSRGIALAVEQINAEGGVKVADKEYRLRIVTGDDQANPTMGVAALRKMLAQDVRFLLGPFPSAVAKAVHPIAARQTKLTQLIDGSIAVGITDGRTMFRSQATVDAYNNAVLAYAKAQPFNRMAMMTDRMHSGFMESQAQLSQDLRGHNVTITHEMYFKLTDTEFAAQLTNLRGDGTEVLLIRGYPAEGALITRQARQLGFKGRIVWEMVSPPSVVLKNISARQMDGVVNCIPATTEDFIRRGNTRAMALGKRYVERYHEPVGELTALGYDSVYMFKAAFERAGDLGNDAVNGAMAALTVSEIPHLIGDYAPYDGGRLFSQKGQVDTVGVCNVWRDDSWFPLETRKLADAHTDSVGE